MSKGGRNTVCGSLYVSYPSTYLMPKHQAIHYGLVCPQKVSENSKSTEGSSWPGPAGVQKQKAKGRPGFPTGSNTAGHHGSFKAFLYYVSPHRATGYPEKLP